MIEREKQIADYYGYDIQSRQTCEELAELIQAICKHGRMSDGERALVTVDSPQRWNVKEEMADVHIMLDQMQYLLNISDEELDKEINRKLNRQIKRIKELQEADNE